MADVIWHGEWLLQRELSIITMSLSSLLEYLLLHCHHKTCEVCYLCLSEFFHTCRQAASVTAHCESLAFILNELSFQLEGRQNKGIRTTQSRERSSSKFIYLGVVPLRTVLNLGPSWPRHNHLVLAVV